MHGRMPPSSQGQQRSTEYSFDGPSGAAPPQKRGGLRALVSKFENLASTNKKPADPPLRRQANGLGTKGRGWRGAVGLPPKKEETINESSEAPVQRMDSLEIARNTRADEIKLERKEPSGDSSVKSQNSLIVRGRKEGRRLLNGLSGRVVRENKPEPKAKGGRRESLVQLRVRALETVKGSKEKPSALREEVGESPPPLGQSSNGNNMDLTPTTTHTQGSSGGKSGRQRKLQKAPPSSKPAKSSNLMPKPDVDAKDSASSQVASVDGNTGQKQKKVLTKKNPSEVKNLSETSSGSVHDVERDPRSQRPSEAQVFSLAARPDHGAPRKSVAPTIRERITMFESAKDIKGTSIVALLGAGATAALKRRIADEGIEDGAEVHDIMRRVQYGRSEETLMEPQQGYVEEHSLTRGSTIRRMSPVSRYLEERKRSSISTEDGKVNGKYVSAFASRRSGVASPEVTRAVFQAVKATTPQKKGGMTLSKSEPVKLNALAKKAEKAARMSPVLHDMIMRRQSERNALSTRANSTRASSRQPSPHSFDGHMSLAKRTSQPHLRPMSAVPHDLLAPPAAPSGTPPGTVDNRVAELIALAAEDDDIPIISKGVAEDYHEIERLGSAMGGMKQVPIGTPTYLAAAKASRINQQPKSSMRARAVTPRARTPLQRSRSSLSSLNRILGRDGASGIVVLDGPEENKENIPSDDEERAEKRKMQEKREEEERTLVVRSAVELSEPKPLRLVEISRMLRMARFGRSRSGGQRLSQY